MQAGMQVWSQGDQAAVAVSRVSCWGPVSHGGPGQGGKLDLNYSMKPVG